MTYRTLSAAAAHENIVKRSRFLGLGFPISGVEDAERLLCQIRSEHPFATHVCYAYVADEIGNTRRFSDDGEPGGTAGMPLLKVLEQSGLKKVLLAVVRYFGGVKLGTGGLARAYGASAEATLAGAGTVTMTLLSVYYAEFGYGAAFVPTLGEEILREYGDDGMKVEYAVTDLASFQKKLEEKFCKTVPLKFLRNEMRALGQVLE